MTRPRSLTTMTGPSSFGRQRLRRHRLAAGQPLGDAAQRHLQPLALDRLGQVVDRLEVEGLERVLRMGGDEDDRRRRRLQAQLGGELGAVAAGHLHVEQHQVALVGGEPDQRLRRVRRLADHGAARLAAFGDQAASGAAARAPRRRRRGRAGGRVAMAWTALMGTFCFIAVRRSGLGIHRLPAGSRTAPRRRASVAAVRARSSAPCRCRAATAPSARCWRSRARRGRP